MDSSKPNYMLKVLLLGESGSGKTSLLLQYCNKSFSPTYITTIGIDFKIKTIRYKEDNVKLQIWDTAGQERFRTITSSYYRGSSAVIIMYDITDRVSFNGVNYWIDQIMKSEAERNITILLVGNKTDLAVNRVVEYNEGLNLSKKHSVPFFETSAKNGSNIEEVFTKLIELSIAKKNNKQPEGIIISPPTDARPKKCC